MKFDSHDRRIAIAENTMTEAVVISPAVADLLRNAGLLKGDAPPPPPPRPPTAPEPKVGDIVTEVVPVVVDFEVAVPRLCPADW